MVEVVVAVIFYLVAVCSNSSSGGRGSSSSREIGPGRVSLFIKQYSSPSSPLSLCLTLSVHFFNIISYQACLAIIRSD